MISFRSPTAQALVADAVKFQMMVIAPVQLLLGSLTEKLNSLCLLSWGTLMILQCGDLSFYRLFINPVWQLAGTGELFGAGV